MPLGLLTGPLPQARQRAIEMEIRRMNETHVPPHWGVTLDLVAPTLSLGQA